MNKRRGPANCGGRSAPAAVPSHFVQQNAHRGIDPKLLCASSRTAGNCDRWLDPFLGVPLRTFARGLNPRAFARGADVGSLPKALLQVRVAMESSLDFREAVARG